MAKRGPKPKPTARLRLEGSRRAAGRGDDLVFPNEQPEPPAWLSAEEAGVFEGLADRLACVPGLTTGLDQEALAQLAHAVVEFRELSGTLRREGYWSEDGEGNVLVHPAVKIRQQAWTRCKLGFAHFGLSPADRAALKIAPPTGSGTKKIGLGRAAGGDG